MTNLLWFGLLNVVVVAFVFLIQRRVIFSWSTIGVFSVTNLVVVQVGVLALPFYSELAEAQFGMNLSVLDAVDWKLAIILNVWGAGLVLASYHVTHMVFNRWRILQRAPNLLALDANAPQPGFDVLRLLLFSNVGMLLAGLHFASGAGQFYSGIQEGFVKGDHEAIVRARYVVGAGYAYILTVFNVLPFFGVALWLTYRLRGGGRLGLFAGGYCGFTAALLLLTFQKRPLLVFLCAVLLVNIATYERVTGRRVRYPTRRIIFRLGSRARWRLVAYAATPVIWLMLLNLVTTQIGRESEDLISALVDLVTQTSMSLFSGLALPTVLYVHYFPQIEPHYAFRAVGLVAKIVGFDVYPATVSIFQYFSPKSELGSVAIGAVTDFYGAFGFGGWLVGTLLLGVVFNRVDCLLSRCKANGSRLLLTVFAFVTSYYLSNASIYNALLGYGGGIFVALWVVLVLRVRPSVRSEPAGSAALTGSQ